jgi:sporulation protein YunB
MGRNKRYHAVKRKMPALFLLVVGSVLLCSTALTLKNVIAPNLEEIGRMRAKVMVNQIVNKAINDRLYEEGDMQELLLRTADDGGKTEMIQANTKAMNLFVTELSNELQKEFAVRTEDVFYIPAGTLLGDGVLSQMGPEIKLRVVPLSVGSIDFETEFESQGINQTKYKVYIEVGSDVKVLSPFSSEHMKVSTTVLVAEAVILGTVPNNYVYVPEEDILDVTQE